MTESSKFKNFPTKDFDNYHRSQHSHSNSNFSFDEKPNPKSMTRQVPESLINLINLNIKEVSQTISELSQPFHLFKQAKTEFLKLAEREAEREIQERKFELQSGQENLQVLLNDLKSYKKSLTDPKFHTGLNDQFLINLKERLQKTVNLIEEEKNYALNINLDLEIVPKSVLKETKDKIRALQCEIERFKSETFELTPDTARIRPKETDSEMIVEIDELICQRIKDTSNLISTFSQSRPQTLSLISRSPDFDPHLPLKCFDNFRVLETKILALLKNLSFSGNSENDFEEINEMKSVIQSLSQENMQLKEKFTVSRARENEMNLMLRNKELSFEEKISDIRDHTQNEMLRMQEALGQIYEKNNLHSKISELEAQLKEAQESSSTSYPKNFERELDNVRRIYNDKYEELFKITSEQISELEQKLRETSITRSTFMEDLRASIRREESKLRDQEVKKLTQLHCREMRLVQSEFEDFLNKSKIEIAKLGKLVEKAIQNSDYKLLDSIQEDIHCFHERVQSQALRMKDESFSLGLEEERQCKRCGLNEGKSKHCSFHPYLVGSDAQEMLYSDEWHKCRENRHKENEAPCVRLNKHYYPAESSNFVKIFEKFSLDTVSFAGTKNKPDSPSRTLQEALFSTDKKIIQEASATDLLDSYIAKYA